MPSKDRIFFPQGVNMYVPGLAYVNGLVHGQPIAFSLGSPAAADDDIVAATIDADAVAGVTEYYDVTIDATYGRCLELKVSADPGAASSVIDIYGWDYLNQPIVERFTTANGSTSIIYGKKAFKRTYKSVIVTAATNAITAKVGTSTRLGLPYKGDIAWAKENGILVPINKRSIWQWRSFDATSIIAGPSGAWVYAEFPGYVKTLKAVANMAVGSTNDPVVTVELGGTAITGLTVTADTSAAATGALVSDVPTTEGYSANNRFVTGGLIEIVIADADASGGITVGLELQPTQFVHPVTTDPQTSTTGDPRGVYDPITAPDGSAIVVGLIGDNSVNASGNGGFHGIKHVNA